MAGCNELAGLHACESFVALLKPWTWQATSMCASSPAAFLLIDAVSVRQFRKGQSQLLLYGPPHAWPISGIQEMIATADCSSFIASCRLSGRLSAPRMGCECRGRPGRCVKSDQTQLMEPYVYTPTAGCNCNSIYLLTMFYSLVKQSQSHGPSNVHTYRSRTTPFNHILLSTDTSDADNSLQWH